MKRTNRRKLTLERTTIQHLTPLVLGRAQGGQTIWGCSDACTLAACGDTTEDETERPSCHLDTQFVHGCAG